ncbi:MAG: anthranilate synthase component I [Phycisphaeraceae bacterium]|nr:anthranilate synthase component I [Phycisphaeraceae bacterium]
MVRRLLSDQLTPVLVYRRLVRPDDRMAPSFLFESVEGGARISRYSFMGAQPVRQIIARGHDVQDVDCRAPERSRRYDCADPLGEMARLTADHRLARVEGLVDFTGGWVGYAGYDTVRYLEGEKLGQAPPDDRHLPDLQMGLYRQVVAFDHVQKTVLVITNVAIEEHASVEAACAAGERELDELVARVETPVDAAQRAPGGAELRIGSVDLSTPPPTLPTSNMGDGGYQRAVEVAKRYIAAGDIFQVVPSQRFALTTGVDPFDIYRALRVVNPSPYMFYVQIEGGMLVGSSPEILCRVDGRTIINRPLAGTRRRGRDDAEDQALESELLADPKDRAEHIMLVDLGRNDVGRIAEPGSIRLPEVLSVERYSHVMHISSTVEGRLRPDCTCWDALRYTLPVGTVSGAPKVRAMQIIDELEPTRRGPYAGAVGYADFTGNMDMAIALRTMVIMPSSADGQWTVHVQAGGGIVADSDPDAEFQETVNKAAAMAKSVAMAETAFG